MPTVPLSSLHGVFSHPITCLTGQLLVPDVWFELLGHRHRHARPYLPPAPALSAEAGSWVAAGGLLTAPGIPFELAHATRDPMYPTSHQLPWLSPVCDGVFPEIRGDVRIDVRATHGHSVGETSARGGTAFTLDRIDFVQGRFLEASLSRKHHIQ